MKLLEKRSEIYICAANVYTILTPEKVQKQNLPQQTIDIVHRTLQF